MAGKTTIDDQTEPVIRLVHMDTIENKPENCANYCILAVFKANGVSVVQMLFPTTAPWSVFYRTRVTAGWRSWVKLGS